MTYNYNYNQNNVDSYNYNNYVSGAGTYSRTHATGFDERVASERASQIFWDAVSVTSSDHNSLAMSQYHSVQELSAEDQNAHLRVIQLNIIFTRSNSINIDSKSSHFSLAHKRFSGKTKQMWTLSWLIIQMTDIVIEDKSSRRICSSKACCLTAMRRKMFTF